MKPRRTLTGPRLNFAQTLAELQVNLSQPCSKLIRTLTEFLVKTERWTAHYFKIISSWLGQQHPIVMRCCWHPIYLSAMLYSFFPFLRLAPGVPFIMTDIALSFTMEKGLDSHILSSRKYKSLLRQLF